MKDPIINVSIEGKSAFLGLNEESYQALEPLFRYHPPGYQYTREYKLYKQIIDEGLDFNEFSEHAYWDGWRHMLKEDGWCPAQLFRAMQSKVEKAANVKFRIINEDCKPVLFKALGNSSNRKYQNKCVDKMLLASQTGGGLVLNATGSGKTYCIALFFSFLDGKAVFIVDELALLKQAQAELEQGLGEKVGMIGDSRFEPQRITVATVQSLHKHHLRADYRRWRAEIDVTVVDEVHKALNRRHFQTVREIPAGAVFGLTATLRLSKRHIRMQAFATCGPVVFQYPLMQGVKEGFLSKGKVIQIEHPQCPPSSTALRDYAKQVYAVQGKQWDGRVFGGPFGKLRKYQLLYDYLIVESSSRNLLIYDLVTELLARGKYVVVLVDRIAHLKTLSSLLHKVPHRVIFGHVKAEDRLDAVKDFERDEFRLIITNVVFNKGINIKRLDAIVNGAARKNPDDALQAFGRGVRLHKDKRGLLYYDVRDTGNKFEDAADDRKRAFEKEGIEVKVRRVA